MHFLSGQDGYVSCLIDGQLSGARSVAENLLILVGPYGTRDLD